MFIERVCEKITNFCTIYALFVSLKCYKQVGCKSVLYKKLPWVVDMKVISSVVWLLESIIDTHRLST